jgi:arylsulfatase A-like enzyme
MSRCHRSWSRVVHALCLALLPLAARPLPAAEPGPKTRPPNLVCILADDLGYGDLACYGGSDLRTPHLDALVASGLRFDHFCASCPVCSPTRAALLTGRYPELVGVPGVIRTHPRDSWGYLSPHAVLLPRLLKKAGYHCALVGKWHLGLEPPNTPNARGFDHFHGFLGDMMDDYQTHRRHGINYMRRDEKEIDPKGHATDLFTQWAIDYLHEQAKADRPFFLYLAYNAPHGPIQPPEEWLRKVRQRNPDLPEKRARLVALVEHLDDGVGRVLQALKESGAADRTLVVFTSDNGADLAAGASAGPLRGGKQDLYEGGLRVPFAASWPGKIRPGTRSDRVALSMDLFPTFCAATGVEPGPDIDGRSFLPLLLGREQPEPARDLFWTRREGGSRYMGKAVVAVRRGDWKLLQNSPTGPFELYNLRDDPKEQTNRAAQERKVFNELAEALRAHIQRGGAVPWQPPR